MSPAQLKNLRRILENTTPNAKKEKNVIYSLSPEANSFVFGDSFAFLVGVIADFGVKADVAWKLPYLLKERLGDLSPKFLAKLPFKKIESAVCYPKPLHRFPKTTARYIWDSAVQVANEYNGDASLIWNSDSALEIKSKLIRFRGISHKKAYMMIKMLIRDWGLKVYDKDKVDLPYDVHNRRVLQRLGISKSDSMEEIWKAGRLLNPCYPAGFDDALWLIGRKHCHAQNPAHKQCPLRDVCVKTNIKATRKLD